MIERSQLTIGMDVVDLEGQRIGEVKEVRDADLLVDRRLQRDIYVPLTLVREASRRMVVLDRSTEALSKLDLDKPSPLDPHGEAAGEGEPASIVTGTGDPAERGTWSAMADNYDLDPTETLTGGQTRAGLDGEDPGVRRDLDEGDELMPLT